MTLNEEQIAMVKQLYERVKYNASMGLTPSDRGIAEKAKVVLKDVLNA